jgi:hypothetical protein
MEIRVVLSKEHSTLICNDLRDGLVVPLKNGLLEQLFRYYSGE